MSDPPLLVFDSARLSVDPGGEAVLGLRLRNQATVVDELEIQVLGPTAEWAAAEPPSLSLFPATDGRAVIRFRPPRTSKLAAGPLPVGVRVVSKVDPTRTLVEEVRLDVGPFRDVTAELWPRSSRGLWKGRHEVRLRNEGNVPAGVSLEPADLDGSCRVSVQPARVVVPPGRTTGARVTVRPSRTLWFGGMETYAFAVRARPEREKELKVEGAMRQGPLVPGTAVMLALVAVVGLAAGVALLGHGFVPLGAVTQPTPTPSAVANAVLPVTPSAPAPSPSASASPSASPSPSKVAPSPTPAVSPSPSPSIAPGAVPWPSPGDCVTYNPATLTLGTIPMVNLYLISLGSVAFEYSVLADADDALALAKRYTQVCYIGRSNTRSNHNSYVMTYWLGPDGASTVINSHSCTTYNPGNLTVVNLGATGFEVADGATGLQMFDTQADAGNAVLVLKHATNICRIGQSEPYVVMDYFS